MLAAGPAKGDEGEIARIGAALHRHFTNGFGDVSGDDPVDARGGFLDAHAELVGDRSQGGFGLFAIESKLDRRAGPPG